MSLILITAAEATPISLAEAKAHCRVDHSDDDAALTSMIAAAVQRLDGRDGSLGRALVTQAWALKLDSFPPKIEIPLPPCQSISSIAYLDAAGASQTLAGSAYQVTGLGDDGPATIVPAYGLAWPSTRDQPEAVTVTFTAGYGDDAEDVPEPIRAAILMHVAHLYDNRELLARGGTVEMPQGPVELLADYRVWSF